MHAELTAAGDFAAGGVDTGYLERFLSRRDTAGLQPAGGRCHG
jgi:hypothetical protein